MKLTAFLILQAALFNAQRALVRLHGGRIENRLGIWLSDRVNEMSDWCLAKIYQETTGEVLA